MPEGDTIHRAAGRIRHAFEGRAPELIEAPQPRHRHDRWPEKLAGRTLSAVDARGKHLLLRFEGGLTLHSHLRMTGRWSIRPEGTTARGARRHAWLVLAGGGWEAVQYGGPVLELMSDSRARTDPRLALLGPDVIGESFDEGTVLRRLREDDPTRPIGDALLDQRTIAGIGNMWKAECCWAARARPLARDGGGPGLAGAGRGRLRARGDEPLGARRRACAPPRRLPAAGPALPPLRERDPRPRAVGGQPRHLLVPRLPGLTAPLRSSDDPGQALARATRSPASPRARITICRSRMRRSNSFSWTSPRHRVAGDARLARERRDLEGRAAGERPLG